MPNIQKNGMDQGLLWIMVNRIFLIIKGPLTAFLLISYLSPHEQGVWYTFSSLGALSVFAELGFTQIVLQFVSQEYAHLSINNKIISGDKCSLDKFFSLIRYSLKFYFIIIPFAIIILSIAGIFVFSNEQTKILIVWFVYSISGGLTLMVSLLQSLYTGINKLLEVQRTVFINNVVATIVLYGFLLSGMGILALPIGIITSNLIAFLLLYSLNPFFWKQIISYKCSTYYNWKKEIIPLQWKYAIGFVASYFIYQLYVPIVYKADGNIIAGQLGITLVLIAIIRSFSDSFLAANYPRLNILIAQGNDKKAYHLFIRCAGCAFLINILGGICTVIFIKVIHSFSIGVRFLDLKLTLGLLLFNIPINFIGILGAYTLLYKDGSLYPLTILAGVIGIFVMFVIYQYFSLDKTFFILSFIYWIFLLPINFIAFLVKRKKYLFGE